MWALGPQNQFVLRVTLGRSDYNDYPGYYTCAESHLAGASAAVALAIGNQRLNDAITDNVLMIIVNRHGTAKSVEFQLVSIWSNYNYVMCINST